MVASSSSDRRPEFHAAFRRSLLAALREALVLSVPRPSFVASAQAASCRSVDRAWRFPRGAQTFTRQLRSQSSQQHSPGARKFQARGRFGSLRVKPAACLEIVLVGKWRPNDSFKPKPLRGSA
jgi:hypothetical protein